MHDRRGWNRLFRNGRVNVTGKELIMIDHRRLGPPNAIIHAQLVPERNVALELDFLLGLVDLYAVQAGNEIVVPVGAAVLAVRCGAETDFLLFSDGGSDALVLDLTQGVVRQGAGL